LAREQRRLAAIVAADVAGYSRLMGRDESGTLAALKALRCEVVDPPIAAHGGRIVKTTGDGLLLEFPSVVDAVRCVIEVQTAMAAQVADVPEDRRIAFRVGVNVGDIISDGDDIFGDGVNIAARLEMLAEAGGACLSDDAYRQVRGKIATEFVAMGPQLLKNIEQPVHAWRWSPEGASIAPSPTPSLALALPDKPSIAVLPFQNMSGDPEQEYFADGIVEDIITALSRFKSLFVIARNSSFTYKGRAVDIKQTARELGVRYVLEGSVRRASNRLRITVQLIEANAGTHVWSERYDGELADVFDLQDRITSSVAGSVEPTLQEAEIGHVMRRQDSKHLGAYDCYLRALALTNAYTREAADGMLRYSLQAIGLDPVFAPPYALAARAYIQRLGRGWIEDLARERAEVLDLVERGLRADRRDAMMLSTAGQCYAFFGRDLVKGIAYIDEAIDINPNDAHALMLSGLVRLRDGQFDEAVKHLERALRLSPRDARAYAFYQSMATALLLCGKREAAQEWALRATRHNANYAPGWYILAAIAASLGDEAEARKAVQQLLALDPSF
jgi:TolB-like protein/class 3 adenylate cyclase